MADTQKDMLAFVSELTGETGAAAPGPKDSLMDSGVIDSINLVRLVQFIEERFGVQIAEEDMDADLFDSVERLAHYIDSRKG